MDIMKSASQTDVKSQKAKIGVEMKQDCGVQTDTHFINSYWDPSYEWNEWVLRRKALQLADLCGKATHSTQTVASAWRNDKTSQAFQIKCGETQTMKEQSTTAPFYNL